MKRWAFWLALGLLLVTTRAAFAHRPIFVEPQSNTTRATAIQISDHLISWALYAQLTQPGEINYYTFAGKRDETAYISVTLPKTSEATQFGLEVALIGNAITKNDRVPFALNPGEHALVASDTGHDPDAVFFEPVTQTAYWIRQDMRVKLPSDGTYLIAVYNAQNKTGKYVLAVGEREEWRAEDVPAFPNIWIGVRNYFGNTNFVIVGIGVLVTVSALTIGLVYWLTRKSGVRK